jgi:hypothetical protein
MDAAFAIRLIAGSVAAAYAAFIIWQRASRFTLAGSAAPVDDLRLVLDLAARLRDAGRQDAVKLCQQLLDELLKPREPKP